MAFAVTVLWVIAALLALWGGSLVWRGCWPRARRAGEIRCPACRKGVGSELVCGACGFEGRSARDFRAKRKWRLVLGGGGAVAAGVAAGVGAGAVSGWFSDDRMGLTVGRVQAVGIGVGVLAAVLGAWSWRGDRSRGRRRCPRCWYDMSGSKLVCPECGHDAKAVKRLYRARRRKLGLAGAVLLLIVAYGVWVMPRVRAGGPVAAVPTWVLIAGLPWWPDWMTIEESDKYEDDWTLYGRLVDDHMWGVERWWLKRRARNVVSRGRSVFGLSRAIDFVDVAEDRPELHAVIHMTIIRGLTSPDAKIRERACEAASMANESVPIEEAKPYLDGLIRNLDDPSFAVRQWSAFYVTHFGDLGAGIVPQLIAAVQKHKPMDAFGFFMGMQRLCRESRVAAHLVVEASHDPSPGVRRACAVALSSSLAAECGGTDRLLEMLNDADEETASIAARSLCRAGVDPDRVIPALLAWAEGDGSCYRFPPYFHKLDRHLQPHVPRLRRFLDAPETQEDALSAINWAGSWRVGLDCSPLLDRIAVMAAGASSELAPRAMEVLETWMERARGDERDW